MSMTKTERKIYENALEVGQKFELMYRELEDKHIKLKHYLQMYIQLNDIKDDNCKNMLQNLIKML